MSIIAPSSVWTPWVLEYDKRNNRVRLSMWTQVIHKQSEIRDLLDQVPAKWDRTTLRFLSPKWTSHLLQNIEASIPLGWRLQNYELNYYGENKQERWLPENIQSKVKAFQQDILTSISDKSPKSYHEIKNQFEERHNWTLLASILENPTEQDVTQIVELYKNAYLNPATWTVDYPFELNYENVLSMLNNNDNIVWVVKNKDWSIISVWIWEIMESEVYDQETRNNIKLRIMEISDTATSEEMTWKWCNTRLISEIIKQWSQKNNWIDVVFWETRSALPAVNHLAINTGRKYYWTLQNSVRINGRIANSTPKDVAQAIRDNPYWDLNVMAMNYDDMKKLYD